MNVGDPYVSNHVLQPTSYCGQQVFKDSGHGGILINVPLL